MADTIVTSVPERLLAVYAVVTDDPPETDTLPSSGGLAVDVLARDTAPLPPAPLLKAMGADSSALAAYEAGTHAVLVRAVGTATFPPEHEFAAYTTAQTLADLCDGVLVDTVIPRVVTRPREVGENFRLSDWIVLPHSSSDETMLWFTSKGLSRFGLPELQSKQVPEPLANAWGAVLTGVAQVLLNDHARALDEDPKAGLRELPADHEVSLRDIAVAYSDRARFGTDSGLDTAAAFRIELDPATEESADSFLNVLPPRDFDGAPDQWAAQVVRTLFTDQGASN